MGFPLYALLSDFAPKISNESLAANLRAAFGSDSDFSVEFELPFKKNKSLAVRWGKWRVSIAYEEGADVMADSAEIQKIVGSAAPYDLSGIDRRVRAVFASDPQLEHTNEIVRVMDLLIKIEGTILYDAKQKELVVL